MYLFEVLFALFRTYQNRFENNIELFKKIGLNDRINNSFASRKLLESYGCVGMFLAFSIFFRDYVGITFDSYMTPYFEIAYFVGITIQQLFISINFNEENILQRKVALFFSLINFTLALWLILADAIFYNPNYPTIYHTSIFIYFDAMVVNLGLTYALIKDFNNFGSGFKEFLRQKVKRFDLSSDEFIRKRLRKKIILKRNNI